MFPEVTYLFLSLMEFCSGSSVLYSAFIDRLVSGTFPYKVTNIVVYMRIAPVDRDLGAEGKEKDQEES